jgi:hypothetical protein
MNKKIIAGTLGLASILSSCSIPEIKDFEEPKSNSINIIESENNITNANKFLREFPNELIGSGEIRKYETSGANKCLIHLLQAHYSDPETLFGDEYDETKKEEFLDKFNIIYRTINRVQKDIFQIIYDLEEKKLIDKVYAEGIYFKPTEDYVKKIIKHRIDKLREFGVLSTEFENVETEKYFYIAGSAFISNSVLDLEIFPAENKKLYQDAIHNFSSRPEMIEKDHEKREDYFLEMISTKKDLSPVILFGGHHSFAGKESFQDYNNKGRISIKDNIREWNSKNPRSKFSLIEIIPKSYKLILE